MFDFFILQLTQSHRGMQFFDQRAKEQIKWKLI